MQPASDELREHGLRATTPRQAVLAALAGARHVTAAEIAVRLAGGRSARVSRQGLYNVLDDLTRVGLVRCIEPAGSPARYELRVGDNHHHLVCRGCGRIDDIDCAVGVAPCLDPSEPPADLGFVVDEAEVTWWGLCASCSPLTVPAKTAEVPTAHSERRRSR